MKTADKKEIVCYNSDASRIVGKAEEVVFPETVEDIKEIIRSAHYDIVPRGAGSNFVGGCTPKRSTVVDMSKMNKILDFNSKKRYVSVEAGVTIKELNEKLEKAGLEFPIQPCNNGISTIGGMIATNASGNRSMKYGKMKEWVEEIEFVNGKGELIKMGRTDIDEVCGMEGITGIIASARLEIIPKMKRTISVFQTDSLDELISTARKLKLEKEIVMIELISPAVSKLLKLPEKYNLIIEFDSERGKATGEEYERIIKLTEDIYSYLYSEKYYNSEDPKFYFDNLKEFIVFLERRAIPYFGFLGTGIMHPFFRDDEKAKREETIEIIKKMRGKPGKYGIGITRKYFIDEFETKMIYRVKSRYDPQGKLNKGKMINEDFRETEEIYGNRDNAKNIKPVKENNEVKKIPEKPIKPVKEQKPQKEIKSEAKTPEEKMNILIKEAELIEKGKENDVKETLKDYEYTYKSELQDEKRKKVEELAKNISRDISNKEMAEERAEEKKKTRETSKEEMDLINKIMGNRYKNEEKK